MSRSRTWPMATTARRAPGGRGRSCGRSIRLGTGATRVQLVPGRALSGGAAAHPAVQPGGEGPERAERRRRAGASRSRRPCDADGRSRPPPRRHLRHLSPRRMVSARARSRRRSTGPIPIGSLDVSLLQDRVLGPILGIGDPRTDKRIDFVGGIRGTEGARAPGATRARWPSPSRSTRPRSTSSWRSPTPAQIMPPKSTWFEPKLRSGLFVHELE